MTKAPRKLDSVVKIQMLDETVKNRLKPNPKVDDQRDNEIRAREELREAMMKKNKEFKDD